MSIESADSRTDSLFDPSILDRIKTPDPDRVAVQFERFAERLKENEALASFCFGDPKHVDMLATLMAGSAFVSDILIRDPELFRTFTEDQVDARMRFRPSERTAVEMERAVHETLQSADTYDERKIAMRRFHRKELFRITASDLLGLWDMPTVTGQLSMLADSMIRAALDVAASAVGVVPAGLAIVGMGKLGGSELNYSSDVDLIFVCGSGASRYRRVGERVIDVLGGVTIEGFLYRVDMRLRPWGRSGALVHTIDAFENYLTDHGEPWEKQALLKARVLAGNMVVGQEFYDRLAPIVFGQDVEDVRRNILHMKGRIEDELRKKDQVWGNVKQGRGSIRDIEFTVQYLQLLHGCDEPGVRDQSTQDGLTKLNEFGILSDDHFRILSEGYTFLRVVEHHLQLYHNRQTHTLPRDAEKIEQLARRLEFGGAEPGRQLVDQYDQHAIAVRDVFDRIVAQEERSEGLVTGSRALPPLVTSMAPAYREVFTQAEIDRHAVLIGRLNRKRPVIVETDEMETGAWRLTVVGFDYLGELSVISGLLLAHGFDIVDGQIFTDLSGQADGGRLQHGRSKIVDVFTVKSVFGPAGEETWRAYTEDLESLVRALAGRRREEALGDLAERVAESSARRGNAVLRSLHPVDIVIDNESDDRFTILHIEAPDTIGFLYELTNALSLLSIDIGHVSVASASNRVRDTLYVTNDRGEKITDENAQDRLRVATVLVQHFTHLLPHAPNPAAALRQFRSLLESLLVREDWITEIASLERPEVLDALARLLGVSDFLWSDFLRMQHETLFPLIGEIERLESPRPRSEIEEGFSKRIHAASRFKERVEILNSLKDEEMFRIDMRYILGHIEEFGQFSAELTDLAEVVVMEALELSLTRVSRSMGRSDWKPGDPCPLIVCALGKFGGRELGFASDIEILFVYDGRGAPAPAGRLTNAQFYDRVVQEFLRVINTKREGVFEVDLRLRPYGSAGSLATSIEVFERYFAVDGPAWPYERQLLIKLRPVAGDLELGGMVVGIRNKILESIGVFDAGSMRAMRERQLRHLVTPGTLNAKYSPGGLVDVEYLTQALQISHLHRYPELTEYPNTRAALRALLECGALESPDHDGLVEALILLRRVIDAMRMVRGNARDLNVPPPESQEMLYLTRRLERDSPAELADEIRRRMAGVAAISTKLLG